MKQLLFFIFSILTFNNLNAQINPVVINCATTLSSGDVQLTWTPVSDLCGPFSSYDIYYSTSVSGPYSLLISIPFAGTNIYNHVGANGGTNTWYYYIVNNYTCPGLTVTNSDTLDNLPPATPNLVAVTVINADAVVQWQPSASPEASGYIIYYLDGSTATPIDTVFGHNSWQYTDSTTNTSTTVYNYTVAALDDCGNVGLFNSVSQHNVKMIAFPQGCNTDVYYEWIPYDNWTAGVDSYYIMVSSNFGPFIALAGFNDTPPTNYTLTGIPDNTHICTYIKTVSNTNVVALSNWECYTLYAIEPPSYVYLQNISVNSDNTVQAQWSVDPIGEISYFEVETGQNASLGTINTYNSVAPMPDPVVQNNIVADPTINPVFAKINSIDSCQRKLEGTQGKTVFLSSKANDDFTVELAWTEFQLDYATLVSYDIYRIIDNNATFIGNVAAGNFSFVDAAAYSPNGQDTICYRIAANFKGAFPDGKMTNDVSYSNTSCIIFKTKIIAPNAFVPRGTNDNFKPYVLFGDESTYKLTILNRWGAVVFESEDITQGWNGKFNGELAPQGVYAWVVQVAGLDGAKYVEKGTVLLLQ